MIRYVLPKTPEHRAALRSAAASVIAIVLAFALHLDKPYWSGMTVVVLANLYTGNILDKAIMRLLGTFLGAWFGFFLAGFIANSFFLYFVMNFLIIAIAVYYYNISQYAYAWLMCAISAFIVIAELAINPADAFYVAVWRPIEICLGVFVSAASAFYIFPNPIYTAMIDEANGIFDAVDSLFVAIEQWFIIGDEALFDVIALDNIALKKKIRKAYDMIGFMHRETGVTRQQINQFQALLDCLFNVTRPIHYFLSTKPKKYVDAHLPINDFFSLIRQDLLSYRQAFFSGDSYHDKVVLSTAMADFDTRLIQMTQLSPQSSNAYLEVSHFLRQISRVLTQLKNTPIANRPKQWISTAQQLRRDPDVMIHSIKAGFSAILALAFWLLSNWPGGLTGIVSSIIISVRRNLFEMTHISIHRLIGCALGAVVFFGFVFFFALDLYAFVLILFFAVWAFSIFSFKNPSYAYIGLQANIALIIAIAQEGGPPVTVSASLERLSGVIIGVVASFLVANLFWRTDLLTMLQRKLHTISIYLYDNCERFLSSTSDNHRFYDLSDSFWLCRSLLESLEQKSLNQHHSVALEQASAKRDVLLRVQVAFMTSYHTINQQQARQTASLIGIDLPAIEQTMALFFKKQHAEIIPIINKQLQQAQESLLKALHTKPLIWLEAENCAAYLGALQDMLP